MLLQLLATMAMETKPELREENGLRVEDGSEEAVVKPPPMKRGFKFWTIIFALCVTGLLGALENTVVSTSMPTIVEDLVVSHNRRLPADYFIEILEKSRYLPRDPYILILCTAEAENLSVSPLFMPS